MVYVAFSDLFFWVKHFWLHFARGDFAAELVSRLKPWALLRKSRRRNVAHGEEI
jgi:hypothetical protein